MDLVLKTRLLHAVQQVNESVSLHLVVFLTAKVNMNVDYLFRFISVLIFSDFVFVMK